MTHRNTYNPPIRSAPIVLEMSEIFMEVVMTDLNALFSGDLSGGLGKPCIVQKTIDSLEEPYKSKLRDLVNTRFADGGLTETDLSKLMQHAGLACSPTMLNRHRRGVCTCPTER